MALTVDHDRLEHARADADRALGDLLARVRDLPAGATAEPSALPGWSRGHVLAHVANVAAALARQAEHAARGLTIEPYDGGAAGRAAGIEAASSRSVDEHVAALTAVRARLVDAWPPPGDAGWAAPVAYRDGVVAGVLLAWWREVRIHAVDALVGMTDDSWDAALCAHLQDFLAVRLPDGGPPPQIEGSAAHVAAWLAGREPSGPVVARRGGGVVALPELGPWPSAQR
ncbi:maleylpyruvate isomerase [Isoptericola sp. CG 20/1183]|uniref:Maleylpyruvate isomerase n=1 Tax=Isoptericola halotolerans TaxID=300560 RepID=A0ABX5EC62_9MICO|nr:MULTISPECIES: maleylpyruvate isomerase family mycothiol-dependent enzyme [Isoptericola]PRZ05114.1 maleylpyruvate isomerase [Isoptericola halotolerans]PRZ05852.1 maleylpyruvate isomerase [Isoptericola sp. CG 20/1183]